MQVLRQASAKSHPENEISQIKTFGRTLKRSETSFASEILHQ